MPKQVQAAPIPEKPVSNVPEKDSGDTDGKTSDSGAETLASDEGDADTQVEPEPLRGGVVGLGAVGSVCFSSGGCNTKDGEWGIGGTASFGYVVLPWLFVDGAISYSYLNLVSENPSTSDLSGGIFSVVAGVSFFPLQRARLIDPVFGLHVGYALERSSWVLENGSEIKASSNGLALQYTLGIDFNLSRRVTLGVHIVLREPIYITSCVESDASNAIDPSTGAVGSDASSSCYSFDGKRDQVFIDPVVNIRFYF